MIDLCYLRKPRRPELDMRGEWTPASRAANSALVQ